MLEVSDALGGPGRVPGATAGMNGVDTSLLCDLLQALTFLTRNEILCIHDTFLKLCPPGKYYKEATLTMDQVSSLPALRALQEKSAHQPLTGSGSQEFSSAWVQPLPCRE
eukprot:XP_016858820.1 calcium and integrin-binding family member 4 isoform X5 [Homo sapiens]